MSHGNYIYHINYITTKLYIMKGNLDIVFLTNNIVKITDNEGTKALTQSELNSESGVF